MGLLNPRKPYDEDTDVSTLTANVITRAQVKGIPLYPKKGQGFSLARAEASDPERIAVFLDTEVRPMLKKMQDTDGPMLLDDAGNFDEAGFDMQDFAGGEFIYLNDGATSHHVLTPFERAPHITLLFASAAGS